MEITTTEVRQIVIKSHWLLFPKIHETYQLFLMYEININLALSSITKWLIQYAKVSVLNVMHD